MSELALDLRSVSKTYRGRVHALREVALAVPRGSVFGLLGPNGAGKSTLVKILTTVVHPTRVEGALLGEPIGRKSVLARVGYLPEHHRFPPYLTGRQLVEHFGAMARVPRSLRRRRAAELLEVVGMRDWADRRTTTYSKGMQQRTGIAMALVNDPAFVILDEPTDGVDPVGRREIRELLQRMRDEGRTVFLNSHLLGEVEMVCDRVAIMLQGRVVRDGTIESLTAASRRYEVHFSRLEITSLEQGERAHAVEVIGELRRLALPQGSAEEVQPIIDALRQRGAIITAVREVRDSLEEMFVRAVSDPTTGAAPPPGASLGASPGASPAPPPAPPPGASPGARTSRP
ncbi:MAG: ABC transporter ATP-binding protein [Phycisphaeraceae bacterium]|nr:ABC transporter ATP-binding protein [Phycisphaeraceae bacterium]